VGIALRCRLSGDNQTRSTNLSFVDSDRLVAAGSFIATFPSSVLQSYGERFSLKALPVDLPVRPWPVVLVTVKGRILSPVVERFIEIAREAVKPLAKKN
jgi:DNA-binding transcriptional LysR family regulator